jgi:hypothetical protein
MKNQIIQCLIALQTSATEKGTRQGLRIYEAAIAQLNAATSEPEISEIHARLKDALISIDTHGTYSTDDYRIVKKILDLRA